jgi:hypothetical protein
MADVHTAMPGVVEKYDPKTRRADIQPSLKRKMPGGKYMDFPIIPNVPVMYSGTKRDTIHFPLAKGDEVLILFTERATDKWKTSGSKGIEEPDPRRFDLQDCIVIPGVQPVDFIPVEDDGINIIHKAKPDGDIIGRVKMDDDKIETTYKEKAKVTMEDDHIVAKSEKCKVDMKAEVIELNNGKSTVKLNGDKTSIKNGSKSLYTILHTLWGNMTSIKPTTLGSPAQHMWNPLIEAEIKKADADLGSLMEA